MRFIDSFRNYLISIPDVTTKFGSNIYYNTLPAGINSQGWWLRWDIINKEPFYYVGQKRPCYTIATIDIDILSKYAIDVESYSDDLVDAIYDAAYTEGITDVFYDGTDFTFYEERGLNVATIKLQVKY